MDETFDIGSDTGTPVDDQDYQLPFAFTGKIHKPTITVADAGGHKEAGSCEPRCARCGVTVYEQRFGHGSPDGFALTHTLL
jgi:hypothetical protein